MTGPPRDDPSFAHRLASATNAHDIDALVACFTDDYLNETPAHPSRAFRGADQVRHNWTRLFAGMPDLTARVLATAVTGDTEWSEWEMSGQRPDGTTHLMRGVIIFGVPDRTATWARFYLEPVDQSGDDVKAAVGRAAEGPQPAGRP
jgi:ketosteroid isomerase-like protein